MGSRLPRARLATVAALALPLAVGMALAARHELRPGPVRETPCWILPNLRTLPSPGDAGCPVGVRDAVRGVEQGGVREHAQGNARGEDVIALRRGPELWRRVAEADASLALQVERAGAASSVSLPVRVLSRADRAIRLAATTLVAGLLLALPFSLVLHSAAPAAFPLALFYTAFCGFGLCWLAGRESALAAFAALACLSLAPGALFHLALSFPRVPRLRREVPGVIALPYGLSGFLLLLGILSVWHAPTLWPAFLHLLLVVGGSGWMVLAFACGFGLRESESDLERARARVVLFGSLGLPLLPAAALALRGHTAPGDWPALYLWSAVVSMPLPIALAISRYNLFDLGVDARQGVARILYLSVTSVALAAGAGLAFLGLAPAASRPGAGPLLIGAFACALAVEPLRVRLPHLLEAWVLPRVHALRATLRDLERRLPGLDEEDEILACAEAALVCGVAATSGAFFWTHGGPPRLTHAFGPAASSHRLAESARRALGDDRLIHLPANPGPSGVPSELHVAGVVLIAAIESDAEPIGLLLLGRAASGATYTGLETGFVQSVAERVGSALRRTRADELRRTREREAAAGRLALALAHDTGKDVHWLKLLSRRLAADPEAPRRMRRDAETIAELSEELAATFQGLLDEVTGASDAEGWLPRLDDVVAGALRSMGRVHGPDRVVDVVDGSTRRLRCPGYVGRVLGNVLDSALGASPPGEMVRLSATLEEEWIRIRVEDHGRTDRRAGLTVAREVTEALGGAIRLQERGDHGRIATIDLPLGITRPPAPVAR